MDENTIGVRPIWYSVKDRLPIKNGKYLSWNGKYIEFQYFEDGFFVMSIGLIIRYDFDRIPFTHWMSLPESPQE